MSTARSRSPKLTPLLLTADHILHAMAAVPPGGRVMLLIPGLLLLGWVARFGRVGLPLAAVVAGVVTGQVGVDLWGLPITGLGEVEVRVGFLLLAGVVGMWADLLHARVGLAIVGAVVGATCGALLWPVFTAWSMLALMVVWPWVYESGLSVTSSLVGVVAMAWATGGQVAASGFIALWALGTVVQMFTGSRTRKADPPAAEV
jgi:hypothetical protein